MPFPRECTFSENDFRILSNFWYPLALVEEIVDKPLKRKLLDVELVIARLDGGIIVAKDLCIHRGAPLSEGWIEENCLVCPYHGYRYDREGQCVLAPSHPDWKIPSKLRLLTVMHEERYGILWVCLSGKPGNVIPDWEPEEADGAFWRFQLGPEIWDCSAARLIENFIDNVHYSFVHQNTVGRESSAAMGADYAFSQDEHTMTMEFDYRAADPGESSIPNTGDLVRHMYRTLFLPFCTRTRIRYPGGREHIVHFNIAPVSSRKARIIAVFHRNFDHEVPDEQLLAWEKRIMNEDRAIVEKQKPEEIPLDISEEMHAKADKASLALRRWMTNLGLEGDMKA